MCGCRLYRRVSPGALPGPGRSCERTMTRREVSAALTAMLREQRIKGMFQYETGSSEMFPS